MFFRRMGLSFSSLSSPWTRSLRRKAFGLAENVEVALLKSLSFNEKDVNRALRALSFKDGNAGEFSAPDEPSENAVDRSLSFRNWESGKPNLQVTISFTGLVFEDKSTESITLWSAGHEAVGGTWPENPPLPEPSSSPRSADEKDAAATKLQKFYKGYRTRRNLADCAVVVEELWSASLSSLLAVEFIPSSWNSPESTIIPPHAGGRRWTLLPSRKARFPSSTTRNQRLPSPAGLELGQEPPRLNSLKKKKIDLF